MRRWIESAVARWRRVRVAWPRALRQIAGFPACSPYFEHCQRVGHAPQLSQRQFLDAHFATVGKTTRCC